MARANVMKFSIIILSYNMEREIPRTIFSVSPYYQKFSSDDYEIILVQNGGNIIEESFLKPIAPNLRSLVPDNIKNLSPIVFNSISQPKLSNINPICYDSYLNEKLINSEFENTFFDTEVIDNCNLIIEEKNFKSIDSLLNRYF